MRTTAGRVPHGAILGLCIMLGSAWADPRGGWLREHSHPTPWESLMTTFRREGWGTAGGRGRQRRCAMRTTAGRVPHGAILGLCIMLGSAWADPRGGWLREHSHPTPWESLMTTFRREGWGTAGGRGRQRRCAMATAHEYKSFRDRIPEYVSTRKFSETPPCVIPDSRLAFCYAITFIILLIFRSD